MRSETLAGGAARYDAPMGEQQSVSLSTPQPAHTVHLAFLACILFIAVATRIWGLDFGLPYSDARPDETTMVQISLGLLFAGLNPRFFHWPSFEFYVLAMLYRVAFEIGHFRGAFRLKFDMFRHAMAHP